MAWPPPEGLAEHLAGTAFDAVTLLTVDELTPDERAVLPGWFLDSVNTQGANGIEAATAHWREAIGDVLDKTVTLFRNLAIATCLGREPDEWGGHIVLIYVLRGDARPFVCWYGYPPAGRLDNRMEGFRPGVKADLTQVSERLRTFYTSVHNRFRLIGWGECGLTPLDEMFTLDGEAAEYDYQIDDPNRPEPNRLLPIFNSSNGSLCVELGTENAWEQDDSMLSPLGELWPALNRWIRRFTEEMATG